MYEENVMLRMERNTLRAKELAKRRANPIAKLKQKEVARRWNLKHYYGITLEQEQEMIQKQGGVCVICKTLPPNSRLGVDHCHVSYKIRGMLCLNCNHALGLIRDNPETAIRMAAYLRGELCQ